MPWSFSLCSLWVVRHAEDIVSADVIESTEVLQLCDWQLHRSAFVCLVLLLLHAELVGYLLSGDPAYITSHNDARNIIRKIERDELLEEFVRSYLAQMKKESGK